VSGVERLEPLVLDVVRSELGRVAHIARAASRDSSGDLRDSGVKIKNRPLHVPEHLTEPALGVEVNSLECTQESCGSRHVIVELRAAGADDKTIANIELRVLVKQQNSSTHGQPDTARDTKVEAGARGGFDSGPRADADPTEGGES
jgi:hypothetical protein